MDPRLDTLISEFQARVVEAVALLEAAGLSRPSSHAEWAFRPVPQSGDLPGGFRYFKHGVGYRVEGREWTVDSDFGQPGEMNGIDSHRLHHFPPAEHPGSGSGRSSTFAVTPSARVGDKSLRVVVLVAPDCAAGSHRLGP